MKANLPREGEVWLGVDAVDLHSRVHYTRLADVWGGGGNEAPMDEGDM